MIDTAMLFQLVGTAGVVCFLFAYYLLQVGKLRADDLSYSAINLAGALLVGASLIWDWNLPAFILEAVWAMISIYGIVKYYRKRRHTQE